MNQGIYCIENIQNNKKYIGSSIHCEKRRRRHFSELKNKKHKNKKLQYAYNKYGFDNFSFYVIEKVTDKNLLIEKEQFYIDSLKPFYNINKIADSCLGVKRSKATKEKIRQANLGLKHPDWRNKIKSEAQGGDKHWTKSKNFTNESKIKMSNAQIELYKNGYISPRKGKANSQKAINLMIEKLSVPVIQYDLNNNFIKEWKSAKEASLFGFDKSSIAGCCRGRTKKHGGFVWKYKNKEHFKN